MGAPVLVKPIPAQVINEQAAYGPFDLKQYIEVQEGGTAGLHFQAELSDGQSLPQGLICTSDGLITGIPAKGTEGHYEIIVTVKNEAGLIKASFTFAIKPSLLNTGAEYADRLKAEIWEAIEKNLPLPGGLEEVLGRAITPIEIYYLLERFGILKIWDAFNLDPPHELKLLSLEGVSKHYHVYDRGSCLVAVPKDIFSHERTMLDGLQTARAVAREAFARNWTVELVGLDKLVRAAWVELQLLSEQYGRTLDIVNFDPTSHDIWLYNIQQQTRGLNKGPELES